LTILVVFYFVLSHEPSTPNNNTSFAINSVVFYIYLYTMCYNCTFLCYLSDIVSCSQDVHEILTWNVYIWFYGNCCSYVSKWLVLEIDQKNKTKTKQKTKTAKEQVN
jgi:hypothetical protein